METQQNLQLASNDDVLTSYTQSARSKNEILSVHNLLKTVFRLDAMTNKNQL